MTKWLHKKKTMVIKLLNLPKLVILLILSYTNGDNKIKIYE